MTILPSHYPHYSNWIFPTQNLSTDNILVDSYGICKISGFGSYKRTNDSNENGIHTSLQTSIFRMAPEVIQSVRKGIQHGYNEKNDIWSLGCAVLEMWAGCSPWQDTDASSDVYEVTRNCYKRFFSTDLLHFLFVGWLSRVLLQCLQT